MLLSAVGFCVCLLAFFTLSSVLLLQGDVLSINLSCSERCFARQTPALYFPRFSVAPAWLVCERYYLTCRLSGGPFSVKVARVLVESPSIGITEETAVNSLDKPYRLMSYPAFHDFVVDLEKKIYKLNPSQMSHLVICNSFINNTGRPTTKCPTPKMK